MCHGSYSRTSAKASPHVSQSSGTHSQSSQPGPPHSGPWPAELHQESRASLRKQNRFTTCSCTSPDATQRDRVLHMESSHHTPPLTLIACTLQNAHTEGRGPHLTGYLHSGVYVMSVVKSVFQTLRGGRRSEDPVPPTALWACFPSPAMLGLQFLCFP